MACCVVVVGYPLIYDLHDLSLTVLFHA